MASPGAYQTLLWESTHFIGAREQKGNKGSSIMLGGPFPTLATIFWATRNLLQGRRNRASSPPLGAEQSDLGEYGSAYRAGQKVISQGKPQHHSLLLLDCSRPTNKRRCAISHPSIHTPMTYINRPALVPHTRYIFDNNDIRIPRGQGKTTCGTPQEEPSQLQQLTSK